MLDLIKPASATYLTEAGLENLLQILFPILPGLMGLVEAERQRKLEDARAQVAWNAEVAANLLQKLRSFFSSQLAATNFVLHPVQSAGGHAVATLATPQLPPEVQVSRLLDVAGALGENMCAYQQRLATAVYIWVAVKGNRIAQPALPACGLATATLPSVQPLSRPCLPG